MWVYMPYTKLPSTYQEVEYIQSNGTQYIDTWVYVNPDYTIEMKFEITSSVRYNTFFGTRTNWQQRYVWRTENIKNGIFYIQRSKRYTDNSYESYEWNFNVNQIYTLKMNQELYIDWSLKKTFSASTSSTPFDTPLALFALRYDLTTAWDFFYWKIYYCKLWDDSNNLIRDFVPCYRKSDNVIWLYDLVNNQFYTNSWSWTFSKGDDITAAELKNAYIGDWWWRLSTDFTQYTSLAQIQAQWWTGITNIKNTPTYTYSSSGIWVKSSATDTYWGIYVKLPAKITNQNKIIMEYTGSVSSSESGVWASLCTNPTPNLTTNNQTEFSYSQSYRNSATLQWVRIDKNVNGTKTRWLWENNRNIQWIPWTYEAEVILDLPNSKSKWICTSPSWMAYTSEATISSAWINCIVWTEYFIIWGVDYSRWVTTYIKSASIAVI